jgi:nucleoside-diphosphate-sugar epimerase
VTDKGLLERAVEEIDVVIHLAGITDAPSTINHPDKTHWVNVVGTERILDASIKAGVKKFLFPSTTSVYGEAEGLVDESCRDLKPSSPYAETKLEAENIVIYGNRINGIETFVLRKGTIFGNSIGMRFHTAVNKFAWQASMGLPLTVWDSALKSMRPYLGINDAVRAYNFVMEHGRPGTVYNVVTANHNMEDILSCIRYWKKDVKIEITKSPILNQKPYEVSNKKIRNLGFEFKDDLGISLEQTIRKLSGIDNSDLRKE